MRNNPVLHFYTSRWKPSTFATLRLIMWPATWEKQLDLHKYFVERRFMPCKIGSTFRPTYVQNKV